jgi:hypothetical protein
MRSYQCDNFVKVLSVVGVFAFVAGRAWHEALALQGGIPFYNFFFYGFSVLFLYYVVCRGILSGARVRRRISLVFFIIATLTSLLVIVVSYLRGDLSGVDESEFVSLYFGYILSSCSYAVLGYLSFIFARYYYRRLALAVFLLAVLPVFLITDWTILTIVFRDYVTGRTINYLLLGDIIVFAAIVYFLSSYKGAGPENLSFSMVFLLIVVLFINNSRSSLLAFILALFLAYFLVAFTSKVILKRGIGLVVCGIFGVAVLLTLAGADLLVQLGASRVVSLFTEGGRDGSLAARSLILEQGVRRIQDHFILGDIGGQIMHPLGITPLGSYIHNVLSHWEQFGALVFFCYLLAWGFLLKETAEAVQHDGKRGVILVFAGLYCVLSILFARAFVHTVFSAFFVFLAFQVSASFDQRRV